MIHINILYQCISVCAPFNKIDNWAGQIPDESILKILAENWNINICRKRTAGRQGVFLDDIRSMRIRK